MSNTMPPRVFDVVIVGGGAAGVMTAIHWLHGADAPADIALVEPTARPGCGVAYATSRPEHVLNVPAKGMSAFDDAPHDFLDYLAEAGAEAEIGTAGAEPGALEGVPASRFIERQRYGRYLADRLARAREASPARLRVLQDRVACLAFDRAANQADLELDSGQDVRARSVVLALGNTPRPLPVQGATQLPDGLVLEAWDVDAIGRIDADDAVCIVGSGLSMADTVLSLEATGHRGTIHVLSRHALLPLPHAATQPASIDVEALLRMGLRTRVRHLREQARDLQARGAPWQSVMERLRPHGQALWQSLSIADQSRFLRHVVRFWDVHRHRIAAPVHAQLQRLVDTGRLQLHRGRVDTVRYTDGRLRVRTRHAGCGPESIDVDRLVNATGAEMRAWTMRNPFLNDLLAQGLVQPGPHGIGVKVARDGSAVDAEDRTLPWLQVLGSLRVGCLWESTAVPELRGQAERAALQLRAWLRDASR